MSDTKKDQEKLNSGLAKGIASGLSNKEKPTEISPEFNELIGRALVDQEFRKELFTNQEMVLKKFELKENDLIALKEITDETLKKHIEGMGGAVAWKIYVHVSKSF